MGEQDKNTLDSETEKANDEFVGTGDPAVADDTDPEEGEKQGDKSVEELHLMLEDARNKADTHWNDLLRVQAEQENLRKRTRRDVENAHKYGLDGLVRELLPVKDSLELGLSVARESGTDMEKVVEGMELTLKMFNAALEKFNVREVYPLHEKFDPELHQAMAMQPSKEVGPNTVITVYQKGYLLNDRLVRPAMVVVSSG